MVRVLHFQRKQQNLIVWVQPSSSKSEMGQPFACACLCQTETTSMPTLRLAASVARVWPASLERHRRTSLKRCAFISRIVYYCLAFFKNSSLGQILHRVTTSPACCPCATSLAPRARRDALPEHAKRLCTCVCKHLHWQRCDSKSIIIILFLFRI